MAKFFHHSALILRPTTGTTDGKCAYCGAIAFSLLPWKSYRCV